MIYVTSILNPASAVLGIIITGTTLEMNLISFERLLHLENNIPPELIDSHENKNNENQNFQLENPENIIEFRNAGFKYQENLDFCLKKVNLQIKKGEKVNFLN